MNFLRVENDVETVNLNVDMIDAYGEQRHPDGSKNTYVIYHSGERSISFGTKEPLETLEKRILAAKSGRPAPKKRK